MYINNEMWENLKNTFKELYSDYDHFSNDVRNLLDNVDICINDIENKKQSKIYVITNDAIVNDEIDYQIAGVAFTKDEANKMFEETIRNIKIDVDFNNLDVTNDNDNEEYKFDGKWHYSKTDHSFDLYLEGEYNSNNFSVEIKEYDITKSLDKEMEVDL